MTPAEQRYYSLSYDKKKDARKVLEILNRERKFGFPVSVVIKTLSKKYDKDVIEIAGALLMEDSKISRRAR